MQVYNSKNSGQGSLGVIHDGIFPEVETDLNEIFSAGFLDAQCSVLEFPQWVMLKGQIFKGRAAGMVIDTPYSFDFTIDLDDILPGLSSWGLWLGNLRVGSGVGAVVLNSNDVLRVSTPSLRLSGTMQYVALGEGDNIINFSAIFAKNQSVGPT